MSASITTSPSAYLLDVCNGKSSLAITIIFSGCLEDDALDAPVTSLVGDATICTNRNLQVQTHTNGITRDEEVIVIVRIIKQTCLLGPGFWWETAINNGSLLAGNLFNLST